MKIWVLAGLFTAATIPFAAAAETTSECQVDQSRIAPQLMRIDSTGPGGGAAAPPTAARPTSAPREAAEQAAPRAPAEPTRAVAERRRNGKRIPDAELIGPRGAL